MTNDLPDGWTIEKVRELEPSAQVEEASRLSVFDVTRSPHVELSPEVAISFGGHFLIRCVGSPDWWMGQRDKTTGDVQCWGTYGPDLASAIRGL